MCVRLSLDGREGQAFFHGQKQNRMGPDVFYMLTYMNKLVILACRSFEGLDLVFSLCGSLYKTCMMPQCGAKLHDLYVKPALPVSGVDDILIYDDH